MSDSARTIVETYCAIVPAQVDALLALVDGVSASAEPGHAMILDAIGEAHRMGGAAHCMGFGYFGAALLDLGQQMTAVLEEEQAEPVEALWRAQHLCGLVVRQGRYVRPENSTLLKSLALGSPDEGDRADADPARFADERILLVEDDPSIRDLVGHILQEEGFDQLAFAESGAEALEIIRTFEPTLILSDWSMKGMSGLELLRQIRSGESALTAEAPVILITAPSNLGKVRAVVREGANHFLLKPFTREVLVGAIEKVLHRSVQAADVAPDCRRAGG